GRIREFDVDPAQLVDESLEPDEVDLHVVVDLDAEVLLDGLDHQAAATEGICGVDPVLSMARDVDPQIAGNRQHLHRGTAAVHPDEHDHVAAGAAEGAEVGEVVETLPGVRSDDQEGEGTTGGAVEGSGDLSIGVGAAEGADVGGVVGTRPGVRSDVQEGEGAVGGAVEGPGALILGVGAGQKVAAGVDEVESQTRQRAGQYQEGDDDGLDATRGTAWA